MMVVREGDDMITSDDCVVEELNSIDASIKVLPPQESLLCDVAGGVFCDRCRGAALSLAFPYCVKVSFFETNIYGALRDVACNYTRRKAQRIMDSAAVPTI
jgi:hypothetical protein